MQSYLLQQRRALLVSKGMFKRLCGRNWLFIMEIGSYTWTHGLAKPFIPLLLFFITCALLYLSINIIAKMRLRSMKNTFITFAVYSDGNCTSCENKNRFLSKTGSSKSQVVRMANNLMHYPGHRDDFELGRGRAVAEKQSCKDCESSLQGPSMWAPGTLLQGSDLHLQLFEVVPLGRAYLLSLISSQLLSVDTILYWKPLTFNQLFPNRRMI